MSFASVTIDAGVLAVPSISATSKDAHHYVEQFSIGQNSSTSYG